MEAFEKFADLPGMTAWAKKNSNLVELTIFLIFSYFYV